ncbi:hypothetical protein Acr_24g0005030 [Actinidia rufa]|uniref:Uncharacterized protein n=1 Tax=Actinidia rufa TaxID=165716 RepID=A0A7J0GU42_9ERIC|nr:hypothetical protein Acr_24g0005030 [Actinidia rufa]
MIIRTQKKHFYLNDFVWVSKSWEFQLGDDELWSFPRTNGSIDDGLNSYIRSILSSARLRFITLTTTANLTMLPPCCNMNRSTFTPSTTELPSSINFPCPHSRSENPLKTPSKEKKKKKYLAHPTHLLKVWVKFSVDYYKKQASLPNVEVKSSSPATQKQKEKDKGKGKGRDIGELRTKEKELIAAAEELNKKKEEIAELRLRQVAYLDPYPEPYLPILLLGFIEEEYFIQPMEEEDNVHEGAAKVEEKKANRAEDGSLNNPPHL